MPTGYTDAVGKGEMTDFSQFALRCSRAMGVAIMQRDEATDVPLRVERRVDTHYADTAAQYEREVERLEAATDEQLAREQAVAVAEDNEYRAKALESATETARRYEAMLEQVNAWEPPTPEHEPFKTFMQSQLTESIKHDGPGDWERQVRTELPVAEYREYRLSETRRMRDQYLRLAREEEERVESRAKWIEDFLGSLPDPQAHAKAVAEFEATQKRVGELPF